MQEVKVTYHEQRLEIVMQDDQNKRVDVVVTVTAAGAPLLNCALRTTISRHIENFLEMHQMNKAQEVAMTAAAPPMGGISRAPEHPGEIGRN